MFGLGGWEIAVLGVALLVFFGPNKLPQLMKQAGKIMREVRKASYEFQNSLERELEDDPYRKAHRREKKLREKAAALGVTPEELSESPPASAAPNTATDATQGSAAPGNGEGAGVESSPASPAAEGVPEVSPDDKPKTGTG